MNGARTGHSPEERRKTKEDKRRVRTQSAQLSTTFCKSAKNAKEANGKPKREKSFGDDDDGIHEL